jgi:capsular exopolysaccharide synthesis family protein
MDLARLVALVRAHWRWLLVAAIATGTLAYVLSSSRPDRYEASADLLFGRNTAADTVVTGPTSGAQPPPERTAANNLALASLETIAAGVKQRLGPGLTVEQLKDAARVQVNGDSDVATVTAKWSTPAGAARVANGFADEIVRSRRDAARAEVQRAIDVLNRTIAQRTAAGATRAQLRALRDRLTDLEVLRGLQTGDVQIVERAVPPLQRSSPKPARDAVIGGLVGLLLGLGGVVLMSRFDQRIRDDDELAALVDAPVLARVPTAARGKRVARVGTGRQDAAFVEALEFLRLNIQLMSPTKSAGAKRQNGTAQVSRARGQDGRFAAATPVIAVTSPMEGDGKSTVVSWLSHLLAAGAVDVVAVDLDLRRPTLHTAFNLPDGPGDGVLSALLEAVDGAALTRPTQQPHLRVLPGAADPVAAVGVLGKGRVRALLEQVRREADFVLVDTSPVATVADSSAVAAAADGVILVVDLNRTRRRDVLAARQQLRNASATILGIVVNHAAVTSRPYYTRDLQQTPEAATA